jgi:hypothetical protein
MYRIIGADGREYGPISADQLRQWITEGRANSATHVLVEGAPEWKPLGSLPEFSLLFAARTPAVTPAPFATGTTPAQTTNAFATTGLVLGIISLSAGLCCCYGLPFNVSGLIFSLIALSQIRSHPEKYSGRGMAVAGLVLCLTSLALMFILFILAIFGAGFGQMTHHAYRL